MDSSTIKKLCWALYAISLSFLLTGTLGQLESGFTLIILGLTVMLFARVICLNNLLSLDGNDRMLWAILIMLLGIISIPFYLIRHYQIKDKNLVRARVE